MLNNTYTGAPNPSTPAAATTTPPYPPVSDVTPNPGAVQPNGDVGAPAVGQQGQTPTWGNYLAANPGATNPNTPAAPTATPVNYGTGATGANAAMLAWLNANASGTNYAGIAPQVDAFNSQYGLGSGSGLAWYGGKNIVAASGGGYYAQAPGGGAWGYNVGDSGGGPAGGQPLGTGGTLLNPYGSGLNTPPPSDSSNNLFNLLMGRAQQSLVVDPNDPVIKAQTDAYAASQQGTERNYLSQLAEKGTMGGPGLNTDAANRSAEETMGQNVGQFQAGLMQTELTARRTDIENALQGASGLLTSEQTLQLQQELGEITTAQGAYTTDQNNQYLNSPLSS